VGPSLVDNRVRKLLALGLLLLAVPLGGQAPPERWVWFQVSGGAIAYDEVSRYTSLQTGLSGINTVTYYTQAKPGPFGAYSFLAERLEFECRGNRYRWSKSAMLDRAGRLLSEREDGAWIEMTAQLGAPALYRRLLCFAEPPPPAVGRTESVASLYLAMQGPAPTASPAAPATAAPRPPAPIPPATKTQDAPAPAQAAAKAPEPKAGAPKAEARPFDLNALAQSLRNEAPAAPAESPAQPKLRP
jgi:hypothetical protein